MTMHNWWFGNRFAAPRHIDTETVERLRKDLHEAHKMTDLWKKAYEELDVVVNEFVCTTIQEFVESRPRKSNK
jgi:predicted translin family RNA/ssDNA-binding protein